MHATPPPPGARRHPTLTLLSLVAGVGLLHLMLWQGVADSFAAGAAPEPRKVLVQVRTLTPPAPAAEVEAMPEVVARPAPPPRRAPPAARPTAEPLAPAPVQLDPPPVPVDTEPVLVAAALPAQAPPPAKAAPAVASAPDDVPVYRTKLPPPMTIRYALSYGRWSGNGELSWRPTGEGYEARLEGRVAGLRVLTWASQGGFDAAGLAPVRYTDERLRKGTQAANFQRQAGKITFSGPATEFPLLQGTQDRLSWMVQIAAIAQADPKRLSPGSRVAMYVVGARGDADVWAFRVEGPEDITAGEQTLKTVKLLREPRKPHDTRVEVWLAPSLHHLPVQARLSSEGSAMDLHMQSAQPGPP